MVTAELINYVKGQISRGQNPEAITSALLKQRWNESDIHEVFLEIGINPSAPIPQSTTPPITAASSGNTKNGKDTKSLLVILFLLFFYPVGLLLMYVLTKWKWWVKLIWTLPFVLVILSIIILATISLTANSQGAVDKSAKSNTECATLCKDNIRFDSCYEQCLPYHTVK